jgi:hypothetical protein
VGELTAWVGPQQQRQPPEPLDRRLPPLNDGNVRVSRRGIRTVPITRWRRRVIAVMFPSFNSRGRPCLTAVDG